MALTRSDLKDIVKECLIEILMEGISQPERKSAPVRESASPPARQNVVNQVPTGKKHLDSVSFSAGASKVAARAQGQTQRYANLAAEASTAFPPDQRGVMQSIFEDTMKNTLPSMIEAERNPSAAGPVSNIDPMQIFEGAANWADMAFAPTKR